MSFATIAYLWLDVAIYGSICVTSQLVVHLVVQRSTLLSMQSSSTFSPTLPELPVTVVTVRKLYFMCLSLCKLTHIYNSDNNAFTSASAQNFYEELVRR